MMTFKHICSLHTLKKSSWFDVKEKANDFLSEKKMSWNPLEQFTYFEHLVDDEKVILDFLD